jgi:hypothetical protein
MPPQIKAIYDQLRVVADMNAPILLLLEDSVLEEFEEKARPFANGTMAPIAAHFMSILDARKSEDNLLHDIEISRTIHQLKSLIFRKRGS